MRAIIERRNALGLPGFAAGTPEDARRTFTESQAALPPGRGASGIRQHDEQIPGLRGPVGLRRYLPPDPGSGRIIYCHGGGWVFGTLDGFDPICRQLAHETGRQVVSVDYALAPEARFPDPIDDCWAVLKSEIVSGPVVVMGDSAGGNLAAALALRARAEGLSGIVLQVLAYPVLSPDFGRASYLTYGNGDYLISADDMRWFWDHHTSIEDRANPLAAPLASQDLSGLPEAIIVLGGCDPLHDEGVEYALRLSADGVPTTLRVLPGMAHGFLTLVDLIEASNREVAVIGALIRSAFDRARSTASSPRDLPAG